jgi:hypothetical protein
MAVQHWDSSDVSGYYTEAHRVAEWATTHRTDINELAFACGPDQTRRERAGPLENAPTATPNGIPPPHLDHGRPRTNTFHHPEKLLREDEDEDFG